MSLPLDIYRGIHYIYHHIEKMGGGIIKKGLDSELEVIGQSSYIICDVGSPSQ